MNEINPTSNMKERGWQRSLHNTILICGLAAGQVWAQAGSTKSEPVMAASAIGQPASAEQTLAPKAEGDSFVIGADDVLAVNVWKEPDISRSIPVRSDGKITLPLVGEFQAGGQNSSPSSRRRSRPSFKTIFPSLRSQ